MQSTLMKVDTLMRVLIMISVLSHHEHPSPWQHMRSGMSKISCTQGRQFRQPEGRQHAICRERLRHGRPDIPSRPPEGRCTPSFQPIAMVKPSSHSPANYFQGARRLSARMLLRREPFKKVHELGMRLVGTRRRQSDLYSASAKRLEGRRKSC